MPKTFDCADPAKLCQCSGFEQCAQCRAEFTIDEEFDAVGDELTEQLRGFSLADVGAL